jgi:hypothetical protein
MFINNTCKGRKPGRGIVWTREGERQGETGRDEEILLVYNTYDKNEAKQTRCAINQLFVSPLPSLLSPTIGLNRDGDGQYRQNCNSKKHSASLFIFFIMMICSYNIYFKAILLGVT